MGFEISQKINILYFTFVSIRFLTNILPHICGGVFVEFMTVCDQYIVNYKLKIKHNYILQLIYMNSDWDIKPIFGSLLKL